MSPRDIKRSAVGLNHMVDLVTIYRTLDSVRRTGIAHNHPSSGKLLLCDIPQCSSHYASCIVARATVFRNSKNDLF